MSSVQINCSVVESGNVSALWIVFVVRQGDLVDVGIDTEQAELILRLGNHLNTVPGNSISVEKSKDGLDIRDDPIRGLPETALER
jgi:hypothetical protein